MSTYVLTPLAKADIFAIWLYIAERNENAADRVEQAIFDACVFVAESPLRGHSRTDLTARKTPFLDADQVSELHRCLPAGDLPAPNRGRPAWKKKHSPHPKDAPVVTVSTVRRRVALVSLLKTLDLPLLPLHRPRHHHRLLIRNRRHQRQLHICPRSVPHLASPPKPCWPSMKRGTE